MLVKATVITTAYLIVILIGFLIQIILKRVEKDIEVSEIEGGGFYYRGSRKDNNHNTRPCWFDLSCFGDLCGEIDCPI
ncbi:MAG: hypothetical protein ACUVQ7_00150 [bacterium]